MLLHKMQQVRCVFKTFVGFKVLLTLSGRLSIGQAIAGEMAAIHHHILFCLTKETLCTTVVS